jgi:hypothetical protein
VACLSILRNDGGPVVVLANPIFPLSHTEAELIFEVFEADAAGLRALIGPSALLYLDKTFWARLETLDPCTSTHPGLARLRAKATLRGRFTIYGDREQTDLS